MLRTIAFLLLVSLTSVIAHAQPGGRGPQGTPEEMAKRQTDLMVEKLELSEAQANKALEINLKFAEKMKAARDSMPEGSDWTLMRQKMTVIREQQDAELKKILTSDQWTAYVQLREEQRAQREARRKQEN